MNIDGIKIMSLQERRKEGGNRDDWEGKCGCHIEILSLECMKSTFSMLIKTF